MNLFKRRVFSAALVVAAGVLGLSGTLASSAGAASSSTPRHGGTVTDLIPEAEWPNLDPATDTQGGVDTWAESAIYGQLFELGANGTIVPSEASGYKFSDHNLQLDIYLRHGIKFSDGTPFNAAAVASSIQRDLVPANSCVCLTNFASVKSVTPVGQYDVRLTLSALFSPLLSSFIDEAPNWTVDPTALARMGETAYAQNPVGAGPFEVVSNSASALLVMKKNPHYFMPGRPYLSGLKIEATQSDQSDLAALQSGEANMTTMTTVSTFLQARRVSTLQTKVTPATVIAYVRLNNTIPPFNNPIAREAVQYATNTKSLVANLYGGLYTPIEGFTAPGQLFYQPKVPGFDAYNLAKAKKLVSEIPGGLSFKLETGTNTPSSITEAEALAAQWQAAGINATVQVDTLQQTVNEQFGHTGWVAFDAGWLCGVDPGTCASINMASNGLFSGIHDPVLDGIINQGSQYVSSATRYRTYLKMNEHMDATAEYTWLYSRNGLLVAAKNVHGIPNIAMPTGMEDWDNVWIS